MVNFDSSCSYAQGSWYLFPHGLRHKVPVLLRCGRHLDRLLVLSESLAFSDVISQGDFLNTVALNMPTHSDIMCQHIPKQDRGGTSPRWTLPRLVQAVRRQQQEQTEPPSPRARWQQPNPRSPGFVKSSLWVKFRLDKVTW